MNDFNLTNRDPDVSESPGYNNGYNLRVLSITEVASKLGIGKTSVYKEINERRLKAKKIGNRTVITLQDLRDYINNLEDYQGAKNVF